MLPRLLAAALAVLVLSSCADRVPQSEVTDAAAPAATPTHSSAPSPTPTASVTPAIAVKPEAVFDADCSSLFTESEVSAWLGIEAPLQPFGQLPGVVEQAGGVSCNWYDVSTIVDEIGEEESWSTESLYLTVRPIAPAPTDANLECYADSMTDSYLCEFTAIENGYALEGSVTVTTSKASANSTRADIVSRFAERVAQLAPGAIPLPVAGAWANPVDLDLLGNVDVAAISGRAAIVEDGADCGCDFVGDPDKYWGDGTGNNDYSNDFSVNAIGGGAWVIDQVVELAGAKTVEIEGVEHAILVTDEEWGAHLEVFDGPNRLIITPHEQDMAWLYPVATAFVAELNAQR